MNVGDEDQTGGVRKSSRLAKRKVVDMEEESEEDIDSGKTRKKRTTTAKDKGKSKAEDKGEDVGEEEEGGEEDESTNLQAQSLGPGTTHDTITQSTTSDSGWPEIVNFNDPAPTDPAEIGRPLSPLGAVTDTQRAEITTLYPWLTQIPHEHIPIPIKNAMAKIRSARGSKAAQLQADLDAVLAGTTQPNYHDRDAILYPRDAWIQFLAAYCRADAVVADMNVRAARPGWFDVHWGFLMSLRRQFGKMRRVGPREEGRIRWLD